MKKIINFSLNNKFAVWILTVMVIVAGLYAGLNMKQETMPDITIPNISVTTTYPGAAPDEVEENVTIPLEQRVQNIEGVETVMSSSLANASSIQIEFDFDTDMDDATSEVKETLEKAELPDGAEDPDVSRLSIDAMPVLALSISDSDRSLEELTTKVESDALPALEGIDGVSDVQITGQQLQKVVMDFDDEKLEENGLTEDTIKDLIQGSDISFPLGLTTFDDDVKNLVIDGDVASVDDLKELEIPITPDTGGDLSDEGGMPDGIEGDMPEDGDMPDGAEEGMPEGEDMPDGEDAGAMEDEAGAPGEGDIPDAAAEEDIPTDVPTVQLKDLADIEVVGEAESISRTNGEDSIGVQIVKSPDANTVEVVNKVKDETEKFEDDMGLTVTSTFDQGEPIEDSVDTMLEKALFGIIFAVIVILLFLRSFKTTLISIVSIPLSLLIAVFLLNQMDISLNILTLGALTVAIGRVIDDSIVVMENIYRRMGLEGEELHGKELIREATRQMFIPIFSSTVVTIAVFLPLGLVHGQVGELFLPFALAVVFALSASLLVAITIVPLLAHSLFKKRLKEQANGHVEKKVHKPSRLANIYKTILNWTLNHKIVTFGSAVVLLVLSFFLVPLIGVNFLPDEDEKMVMATYSPEPGETRDEAEKIASDAEELIDGRSGVTTYQYSLGGGSPMDGMMGMSDENSALFFIEYDDDFDDFNGEGDRLVDELNDQTETGEWKNMDFSSMGSGLELYVYGDSTKDIESAVDQVLPILEDHDDLKKVESSVEEAYDQYTLKANQEELSKNGLTAAQIGMELQNAGEAPVLTTVKHDGEDIDVYVESEEETTYDSIDDITDMEIDTPLGTKVKIGDVMDVEEGKSPDTITRRQGDEYASISADIESDDAAGVSNEIDEAIEKEDFPSGVKVEFGGVTEDINESFTQLGMAMLAAIAIVYFVLVVTFGGALAPFAILFSLPFTIIGGLVALWIAGEPLSVSAMIGALMLIGIVVTNAIVLVDRVIHQEKKGLSTRDALLEAGSTRLRPILMTALATIGALIPLAIGMEGDALISKGLGITVIGGLFSSTLLTLVIVPIVYEVLSKFRKKDLHD